MSAVRTPQVGEVWTGCLGNAYTCAGGPDSRGVAVWLNSSGAYAVLHHTRLNPPKPTPPAWLADEWVNVYPQGTNGCTATASGCDYEALPDRIGRVSLAGEWVPCNGKEVLA